MDANQPTELSLTDALGLAILMHRKGELKDAETLYRRILEMAPDYADAIHFYGVLLHHRDRSDEAIAMIERSIALEPAPGRYNNLGNALVERGRLDEAIDSYRRSIELGRRAFEAPDEDVPVDVPEDLIRAILVAGLTKGPDS